MNYLFCSDDLIPEVEEEDATIEADDSQDVNNEDIYENTGVFNQNFTLSVGEYYSLLTSEDRERERDRDIIFH